MDHETIRDREETFELTDGIGMLRLVGDASEMGLLCNGVPTALVWDDCEGSVGQLFALAGALDMGEELAQLRRVAGGALDENIPLFAQIHPLLRLFENGTYDLRERRRSDWTFIDQRDRSRVASFYPAVDTLLFTRPSDSIDPARVREHVERIRAGAAPVAFCATLPDSLSELVVDGHHKLLAYHELRVAPRIVEIIRRAPPALAPQVEEAFCSTPDVRAKLLAAKRRRSGYPSRPSSSRTR